MKATWATFWLLLAPKRKGLFRWNRAAGGRHPVATMFFGVVGIAFAYGIYRGCVWFLQKCLEVELVGAMLPNKLLSLILLILLSILLLSTIISSFSALFLSDDLHLLQSLPVPVGPLYFARLAEMTVHSSWMVLFFGLPVFLAYGTTYAAPWNYYFWVLFLFPALVLVPAVLGATLATILTRLFSARRSRDLLIVLVMLGFVFLYVVIRTARPERLLEEDSFGSMMDFLEMFRAQDASWLPTRWMTDAIFPFLQRQPGTVTLPALALWSTALALLSLSGWIGIWLYPSAYVRSQEGRVRWTRDPRKISKRGRVLGNWLDGLGRGFGSLRGTFLTKDLRVFFRDANQWLQLLLLTALAAVYLLNFVYLKSADFSWFTLYTVNHALMGLVLSGIAVRFVFPAVSLEGRAFWLIRSAPINLSAFLWSKLWINFFPLFVLGEVLSFLSCTIIGVPQVFLWISLVIVGIMTLSVCAIGVGLGATFPRFHVENPAQIPTGPGGLGFMICAFGFVVVFLLVTFYPTFVLYRLPESLPVHGLHVPRLFLSLGVLALLVVAAIWLPMFFGKRRLSREIE